MRIVKFSALIIVCIYVLFVTGCGPELKDLQIQNATQRKLIADLESELQTSRLKNDRLQRYVDTARGRSNIEIESLQQKVAAFEKDASDKRYLIKSMQQQLLYGGLQLPVELSTKLEDFAEGEELVTYDTEHGIVKFKSDLIFEKGSDKVTSAAVRAIESLCKILNSDQAKKLDVAIAGHTDDLQIRKPQTKAKHPTNWHLSSHRAIAVLNVMKKNNIANERMSTRGFGEYKPIAPNKPGKKGNPQNRRVEIYIVPKGI